MMEMSVLLSIQVLTTLAVLWHILAFAAGGVHVFFAYQSLFQDQYHSKWTHIIRSADWQLWFSGVLIIGLGIASSGFDQYIANPKLWAKTLLITTWFISTQCIRHYAALKFRLGHRPPMLLASSVSAACWIYGAFLGVAKPLAYGAVSFSVLFAGFVLTVGACLVITIMFDKKLFQFI